LLIGSHSFSSRIRLQQLSGLLGALVSSVHHWIIELVERCFIALFVLKSSEMKAWCQFVIHHHSGAIRVITSLTHQHTHLACCATQSANAIPCNPSFYLWEWMWAGHCGLSRGKLQRPEKAFPEWIRTLNDWMNGHNESCLQWPTRSYYCRALFDWTPAVGCFLELTLTLTLSN